ncbi:MAG: sigma-70 family RNA polymerase sigma factor [Myxococcota bacterium]|nr:sigma-70 family RNA polymerase sigma factor [Myxococcota bacterium]
MEPKLTNELELGPAEADAVDVEFAVNGDTKAFERLYRRHVPRVNSLARWLLGRDDVDDVIQEVFIRVWEKLDTFRGNSAFSTWLHRLATNVILRKRETVRRDETRHSGSQADLEIRATKGSHPGLRIDIEAAVGRLPSRARQVFVLHDMEGYKHEDVAGMLGISVGTSRSQLHHARMALRSFFNA